jgi:hypothetical protein
VRRKGAWRKTWLSTNPTTPRAEFSRDLSIIVFPRYAVPGRNPDLDVRCLRADDAFARADHRPRGVSAAPTNPNLFQE